MHLGMSGSFRIESGEDRRSRRIPSRAIEDRRARSRRVLDRAGARIVYNDPRRFGLMDLSARRRRSRPAISPASASSRWRRNSTRRRSRALSKACARRSRPRCSISRASPGLGNIYVCEALFRARLSPTRPAASIVDAQGQADARRQGAGGIDRRRARGGDRGRRFDASRPPPDRRRARLFPARLRGLRPRGRRLPAAGLRGRNCAGYAFRPLDVFLPEMSGLSRPSPASAGGADIDKGAPGSYLTVRQFCGAKRAV